MGGCFVFKQINTAKKEKVCFFFGGGWILMDINLMEKHGLFCLLFDLMFFLCVFGDFGCHDVGQALYRLYPGHLVIHGDGVGSYIHVAIFRMKKSQRLVV